MEIRRARVGDADDILRLLGQVLDIHARLRPDIFIPGTTKYTKDQLFAIIEDDLRPVFVAVGGDGSVIGYAFCVMERQPRTVNMLEHRSVYIDDLCVDSALRGEGVGKALLEYVKKTALQAGCDGITLNVWSGNDSAEAFYLKNGFKPKKTVMEYNF